MAAKSNIEWTQSTWNPVTGCSKISAGCLNCYAERMAKRLQAMGQPNYRNGFEVSCHEQALERPFNWQKPQTIFVNSMSDMFHESIPVEFIHKMFGVMQRADWHCFQILTKRAERMAKLSQQLPWEENIWMGVTVENKDYLQRVEELRQTGAQIKFLSFEPLLGPIPWIDLSGIDWVIVGGESGPGARPVQKEWVLDIQRQCHTQGVPFFFKQWGGVNKKKNGRMLSGKTYNEMPATALV